MPHPTLRASPAMSRLLPARSVRHEPPFIASALRESLRDARRDRSVFTMARRDLIAGCVVGIIALPLSMALAIAVGMPPQTGIFTAIVAGFIAAVAGGSRVQVTGPTAAFVVILAPVVGHYGPAGLMVASLGAGVLLLLMGLFRLGRLVEFIPNPVTAGFTVGIATVIALIQIKDLLGLTLPAGEQGGLPAWRESNVSLFIETIRAVPAVRPGDAAVGATTLVLLLLWPRISRRVPAAIAVLPIAAVMAILLAPLGPEWAAATIDSRFGREIDGVMRGGIPRELPAFLLPWDADGPEHRHLTFDWPTVSTIAKYSFAIALLGAIESLLSAVVADGLTGRRHHPDGELVGQGLANVAAPFFGGFAATGALARTAANVRAGAQSPFAAMTHALFLVVIVVVLAPLLGYLPMAALAAMLLIVARNMSDLRHCLFVVRRGPRGDAMTLIACFGLTVIFDMVVAVGIGVVLASLIFMRRMAELSEVEFPKDGVDDAVAATQGVVYYRIRGPLFFGAAQRAMNEVQVTGGERAAILDLEAVPMMDATGLLNLESAVERLHRAGLDVILCGVSQRPMDVLRRAGFGEEPWSPSQEGAAPSVDRRVRFARDGAEALAMVARPPMALHASAAVKPSSQD